MGFGISPFGLSAFGLVGAGTAPLAMANAIAVSTNTVRVTLTAVALHSSSSTAGDALNPSTWSVVRDDTGFVFTVAQVTEPNFSGMVFDITVLEPFGSISVTHTVASTTLLSSTFVPITAPTSEDFEGVASAVESIVRRKLTTVDIANPPNPVNTDSPGGTLVITSGGDYAYVSGTELLKKLIFRRLTTPQGGFFHLPTYGLGLGVKEPPTIADMIALKAAIDQQCEQEPEVANSDCSVSFDNANGILFVKLAVTQQSTGGVLNANLQVPVQ